MSRRAAARAPQNIERDADDARDILRRCAGLERGAVRPTLPALIDISIFHAMSAGAKARPRQ